MSLTGRLLDRMIGYRTARTFASSEGSTLTLLHNSGFFSNCSALLFAIARSEFHPVDIDVANSFSHYSSPSKHFSWGACFEPAPPQISGLHRKWRHSRVAFRLPHHSMYRLIDFNTTTSIINNYFRLSGTVRSRAAAIKSQLPAPPEKLIALCVRGTDKGAEVRQSSPSRYVRTARRLIRRNPGLRVWVQTDQAQLRDYLLKEIGPASFALEVLPTTQGKTVIHKSTQSDDKRQLAIDLLAITWLMSQAAGVVTYSGNVGYWIVLLRGTYRGVHQLR